MLAVVSFHNNVVSYWTILGALYGFAYYRRYQEREKQALRLELRASELETSWCGRGSTRSRRSSSRTSCSTP